ncbi:PREDICTED: uncharacterized protein LOC105362149, partial [Ceratosolen solmsi marchali]|uniref:Uncharacterized protein LOC105362149 n=1 Tax=Ceratosolen solmsi marchali TaxID=326594 RepID=A0AAJ7DVD3_9HYME
SGELGRTGRQGSPRRRAAPGRRRSHGDGGRSSPSFDTGRFIEEIGRRPAIYDLRSEEYSDRAAKTSAWEQVCELMVAKWRSMSDEEKNAEEKSLRSKWRNIRDYFMKELKLQRMRKGSAAGRKRKKYMYFDQLLFLVPNVESKQRNYRANYTTKCKNVKSEVEMDTYHIMQEYEMPLTHEDVSEDYTNNSYDEDQCKYMSVSQFPKSMCETSMAIGADDFPDVISSNSSSQKFKFEDDDYDRMFLLSLLPIMRRIPEDKKVDVRIQMQQALALAIHSMPSNT